MYESNIDEITHELKEYVHKEWKEKSGRDSAPRECSNTLATKSEEMQAIVNGKKRKTEMATCTGSRNVHEAT